jgi:hypothetical protein
LLHCCLSSCALLRRWLIFLMRFVTQLSFLMRLVTQLAGFPYALCYAAGWFSLCALLRSCLHQRGANSVVSSCAPT